MKIERLVCDSCGAVIETNTRVAPLGDRLVVFVKAERIGLGLPGEDLHADLCSPCQMLGAYAIIDLIKDG